MGMTKLIRDLIFMATAPLFRLFVDPIARNLRKPETGLFGSLVLWMLKARNRFVEEKAVEHAEILPHHEVLEIGFGPGIGLKRAAECVKSGDGRIHGIDISAPMLVAAMDHLKKEIEDDKVELTLGNASRLPYRDNSMDRIFHTNCYYFWPDKTMVAKELYRVLKPGGFMVTVLNLQRVIEASKGGYLKYGNWDPDAYMEVLRDVGFKCDGMKTNKHGEKTYESIIAQKL